MVAARIKRKADAASGGILSARIRPAGQDAPQRTAMPKRRRCALIKALLTESVVMTEEGMQGHCHPMAGSGSYQRIEGSIYPQPRHSKRMLLSFYE